MLIAGITDSPGFFAAMCPTIVGIPTSLGIDSAVIAIGRLLEPGGDKPAVAILGNVEIVARLFVGPMWCPVIGHFIWFSRITGVSSLGWIWLPIATVRRRRGCWFLRIALGIHTGGTGYGRYLF